MCCPKCFEDDFLSDLIIRNATDMGTCPHCGTPETQLVDPERLAPYFESLLEGYTGKSSGRFLWELWADDWVIFASATDSKKLVIDVLGNLAAGRYLPRESAQAPSTEIWKSLRQELQQVNRFFPENAPDRETFSLLIENLVSSEKPGEFFRARLMKGENPYPAEAMGAPPAEMASDGRANPIGIRYLYLADDVQTSIAEIKPSMGAWVSVAKFGVLPDRSLRLIDLTNPRLTISPFRATTSISEIRASMEFLEALGQELSVPTQPHRATRDYLASQYLCELIKVCGFDGVIYRSSLAGGRNFAFFDPSICQVLGDVEVYVVTDIAVTSEKKT